MATSITIFCPAMGAFGGTETHIVNIASLLAARGWEVKLVALRSKLDPKVIAELRGHGVRYIAGLSPRTIWSLMLPADVFYSNSQGNASPLIWKIKGRRQKGFHHIHTSAGPVERTYWRTGYMRFVANAKRLVACSDTTRNNLLEAGACGQVSFLPYLTNVREGLATKSWTPRSEMEPVRFAFIGRVEKPKGIDLIIEAARSAACAGIEWHIFGSGGYLECLRNARIPTVHLHGAFSTGSALREIHSYIDAIILPSWHSEGMPLALLEGMSRGIPWIATDRGGTKELGNGHKDLFVVEAGDGAQFTACAQTLARRIRDGEVHYEEIQRIFCEKFSSTVVQRSWLGYLDTIANGS